MKFAFFVYVYLIVSFLNYTLHYEEVRGVYLLTRPDGLFARSSGRAEETAVLLIRHLVSTMMQSRLVFGSNKPDVTLLLVHNSKIQNL